MRNDLTKACVSCAWRIAASNEDCPRCGGMLVPAPVALEALSEDKKLSTKVRRPVRDILLYGTSTLFSLIAVGGGIAMAVSVVYAEEMDGSSGMVVLFFVIGLFAFIAALAIILGCAWAVLALPIFLVSWLWNRGRVVVLRVAPFAREAGLGHEPPRKKWLDALDTWASSRKKRLIVAAVGVIAIIEIAGELMDDHPVFFQSPLHALKLVAFAAVCQAVALAFLAVPVAFTVRWVVGSLDQLRRIRHLMRERGVEELAMNPRPHLSDLQNERGRAEGRLVCGEAVPLVAPLSGEECLGFRLEGRVGAVLVDDAFVADGLEVHCENERVPVRGAQVVLVVAQPSERTRDLDDEQRLRVEQLLRKLGLPMSDDVELGESLLREGNRVNAHGAEVSEPAQGDGYRSATQRKLLTDADGVPLLLLK